MPRIHINRQAVEALRTISPVSDDEIRPLGDFYEVVVTEETQLKLDKIALHLDNQGTPLPMSEVLIRLCNIYMEIKR